MAILSKNIRFEIYSYFDFCSICRILSILSKIDRNYALESSVFKSSNLQAEAKFLIKEDRLYHITQVEMDHAFECIFKSFKGQLFNLNQRKHLYFIATQFYLKQIPLQVFINYLIFIILCLNFKLQLKLEIIKFNNLLSSQIYKNNYLSISNLAFQIYYEFLKKCERRVQIFIVAKHIIEEIKVMLRELLNLNKLLELEQITFTEGQAIDTLLLTQSKIVNFEFESYSEASHYFEDFKSTESYKCEQINAKGAYLNSFFPDQFEFHRFILSKIRSIFLNLNAVYQEDIYFPYFQQLQEVTLVQSQNTYF